ncbi:MAG: hypothetical protein ACLQEG_05900, partial [Acidimicrobiales bacterium]
MTAIVRRLGREHRMRSQRIYRLTVYLAFLLGVLGLVLGAQCRPGTVPNVTLLGLGASLGAAAIFLFLTAARQTITDRFIDQGIQKSFFDRFHEFSSADWTALIRGANRHYRVLGVANHGYVRAADASESEHAFREILRRNVEVEILWLDPRDPRMLLREEDEVARATRRDAIKALKWFAELRESLPPEQQQRLSLKL